MFNKVEPIQVEYLVKLSITEARDQARACLNKMSAAIQKDQLNILEAKLGSSIQMRLLGLLGGIKAFPRIILITFEELEQTKISIQVSDNFGFGSRVGIAQKIQKLMLKDAQKIKSTFEKEIIS